MSGGLNLILLAAGLWSCLQALGYLAQVIEARRFARRRRDQIPTDLPHNPRVTVVIPCRGLELNFRNHCQALVDQDHPNYELLFVVEDEHDPATAVIRHLMQENRFRRIALVYSGPAHSGSQKSHQLRVGLAHLSANTQIVAFANADLQFSRSWLRWLVCRLDDDRLGAVTGGVWMLPRHQTIWNSLACSMHNSLAACMTPKFSPGLWGSWAMRLDRVRELGLDQVWASAFSDTWSASEALQINGLRIAYEPRSIGIKTVSTSARGLRRSALRWFRSARPRWGWALAGLDGSNGIVLFAMAGSLIQALGSDEPIGLRIGLAAQALMIYGLGVLAGLVRAQLAKIHTPQAREHKRSLVWDCLAWPLTGLALLLASIGSRRVSRLHWGRIVYRLAANGQPTIVGRKIFSGAVSAEPSFRILTPAQPIPPSGDAVTAAPPHRKVA